MEKEKWIVVIERFLEKGYISYGLSIPFLIGVCRLEEKNSNMSLEDFLDSLESALESGLVRIIRCSFLEEDVIGIWRVDGPSWLDQASVLDAGSRKRYYSRYLKVVAEERYSKYDEKWLPFNSIELGRINEIVRCLT